MKRSARPRTLRRGIVLPGAPVGELSACRDLPFEGQIAAMASDPAVQRECALIAKEFSMANLDGLKDACPR